MENVFKETYNALLVAKTEDGGDRTWNGGRFGRSMMKCKTILPAEDTPKQRRRLRKASFGNEQKKFLLVDGVLYTLQAK